LILCLVPDGDLTNPNLKPWVKEVMEKGNDEVLAGKVAFTWNPFCMPGGVPGFIGFGGANPTYFLQTPKEVVIIHGQQFREGDTLVVDTIGQNTRLPVAAMIARTPRITVP
jgi:hypothetical protein